MRASETWQIEVLQPTGDESPWGIGATLWFGLATGLLVAVAEVLVAAGLPRVAAMILSEADSVAIFERSSGILLPAVIFTSAIFYTALAGWFISLKPALSMQHYLALRLPDSRELCRSLAWALLALITADALSLLLGRPLVPEIAVESYRTATIRVFYWAALVIAAPVGEEIFFRGFLFKGVLHSKLGGLGAIVLTSLAWAAIHLQYDYYNLGVVFGMGLVLGYARLKTDSIWVTIAMHSFLNLVATLETAMISRLTGGF